MSYFNEDGSVATSTQAGPVVVPAGSGLNVDSSGNLTNTDRGSSQNIIKTIAVQGDGSFTAGTNNDTVTFAPGGRMALSITGNVISITDYAKGPKKHRAKHKNDTYDPDIDMTAPEDTITFAEGNGILLTTDATNKVLTIATEFTGTNILNGQLTINPSSVGKSNQSVQTFTLTGLTTNHHVVVSPGSALTYGIFITAAWPSADDTLSIQFMNITGSNNDLGNIDIDYFAWV